MHYHVFTLLNDKAMTDALYSINSHTDLRNHSQGVYGMQICFKEYLEDKAFHSILVVRCQTALRKLCGTSRRKLGKMQP